MRAESIITCCHFAFDLLPEFSRIHALPEGLGRGHSLKQSDRTDHFDLSEIADKIQIGFAVRRQME